MSVHDLDRRDFLKLSTGGAAYLGMEAMAGRALEPGEDPIRAFRAMIPESKALDPGWLAALTRRGEPEIYRGDELRFVGMPIGGVACGQLYLGGDGRLWRWDIFRSRYSSAYGTMSMGRHYANPPEPDAPDEHPLQHGFALQIRQGPDATIRPLWKGGFSDIAFRGEYPVGRVTYRDAAVPVQVDLEAFSPFIPLHAADSALPCTLLHYTLRNTGDQPIEVELAGWLENAVCPQETDPGLGTRRIQLEPRGFLCTALPPTEDATAEVRPDIRFADFEAGDYEGWTAEGAAFGSRPFRKDELAPFDQLRAIEGDGLVNTHDTRAAGPRPGPADAFTGTLTSPTFTVDRRYVTFRIGGGKHPGETCLNLVVGKAVVASATGQNDLELRTEIFDVSAHQGQTARIQIVDQATGGWGHVAVDHIVFTDERPAGDRPLPERFGFGSMALRALGDQQTRVAPMDGTLDPEGVFRALDEVGAAGPPGAVDTRFDQRPAAGISQRARLRPGEDVTFPFLLTWFFPGYPDVRGEMAPVTDLPELQRHYATRFDHAGEVAAYVTRHHLRLAEQTRRWNRTWYDSTLPFWFLDRTFISIDCLATTTLHWFSNGRVWGWEGTDCCPGTCQHVWNYAQGMARIFPELERTLREVTDYGIAYHPNGALDYRAECARHVATDGQCGTILRVYREHLMSKDRAFLQRLWPRIRTSIEFMIGQDEQEDGLLEGEQYNTLDQAWRGPMAWISSMYLAAVAAGEAMATEMDDQNFAARCRRIVESGRRGLVDTLFDGEYFIHRPPDYTSTNTNRGCHIDQVLGQSLAWQVGLPRVVPRPQTISALQSLWSYNYAPDAGRYRDAMQNTVRGGRWYAMPGEAGLLMCTWPKGGAELASGSGKVFAVGVGYFNECMNGFEYQVGAHMIWEGEPDSELVRKGLAIARTVHDRYLPKMRNPYNEIECSDHYSRSMMAYGAFLALCRFDYHGPNQHLAFAPRLNPSHFRAAFTAAEGWGSLAQERDPTTQTQQIEVRWGSLSLKTLAFELPAGTRAVSVTATCAGAPCHAACTGTGQKTRIDLGDGVRLEPDQNLTIRIRHEPV